MTPQIARNIVSFLERVQLNGKEAIAWCEAVAAMNEIIVAPAAPLPPMPNHPDGIPAEPPAEIPAA